eukprot:Plantae.Rhodophyta-Hildenbrandia_rubra.ctg24796.p1 GENE.Plantae.Rhodophyta-Hildenbrandia_rubra.ctg24796~~Plantae.Rhodophyta-Hildenbrandia_rubra.ctg24796.p1  ORF type:complete len:273 (-),score=18.02 Plantae.Rhodophyta-Hildenbrandia_rubra.ctg24796:918-1736(-)
MPSYILFIIFIVVTSNKAQCAKSPVTEACSCTVDGRSGKAFVQYGPDDYVFRGCGAHTDYHLPPAGAGYEVVWCYTTDANKCNVSGFEFSTRNTLEDWVKDGAKWRLCSGNLCRAEKGRLLKGDVVRNVTMMAPKDWPDCCEMCGEEERCKGWVFKPNTGECRILETVASTKGEVTRSGDREFAISGFDGGRSDPVLPCRIRRSDFLCNNLLLVCLVPGLILMAGVICCLGCHGKDLITHVIGIPVKGKVIRSTSRVERVRVTSKGSTTYKM